MIRTDVVGNSLQTTAREVVSDALAKELVRMKGYFPFRIVWGYVGEDGQAHVFADYTRRKLMKAAREGKLVFTTDPGKGKKGGTP